MLLMLKNILRDLAGPPGPPLPFARGEIAYLLLCFLTDLSVAYSIT